jgi:hypothetical protein
MAKVFVRTVASRKAAHAMPLHDSRIPAPLCPPNNVNQLSSLKNLVCREFAAHFVVINTLDPELPQHGERTFPCYLTMSQQGFRGSLGFMCTEAQLQSRVPIPLHSLLLHYRAGSGLDDRDRNEGTVWGKNLTHPQLPTNEANH